MNSHDVNGPILKIGIEMLDMDGCLFNPAYFEAANEAIFEAIQDRYFRYSDKQLYDQTTKIKDGYLRFKAIEAVIDQARKDGKLAPLVVFLPDAVRKNIIVNSNIPLITLIINKIAEEEPDIVIWKRETNRQSVPGDCYNTLKNDTDSGLTALYHLEGAVEGELTTLQICPVMIVNNHLMADDYNDKEPGDAFNSVVKFVTGDDGIAVPILTNEYFKTQEHWLFDESKVSIVYRQLHEIASQYSCGLHLKSCLPDNKMDFINQYILTHDALYYIDLDRTHPNEPPKALEKNVTIEDKDKFLKQISYLTAHGKTTHIHLTDELIRELITSNGDHAPPKVQITCDVYDDRMDILSGLKEFYTTNHNMMPKNVILRLHRYDGDYKGHLNIQGTGPIDHEGRASLFKMGEYARCYDPKKPLNERCGIGEHNFRILLSEFEAAPVRRFVKWRNENLQKQEAKLLSFDNNDQPQIIPLAEKQSPFSFWERNKEKIVAGDGVLVVDATVTSVRRF